MPFYGYNAFGILQQCKAKIFALLRNEQIFQAVSGKIHLITHARAVINIDIAKLRADENLIRAAASFHAARALNIDLVII